MRLPAALSCVRHPVAFARAAVMVWKDEPTGLYNARYAQLVTPELLVDTAATVIFFDGNGIKAINDSFGHEAGDRAIKHLADEIGVVMREWGMVAARIGGDEFLGIGIPKKAGLEERLNEICHQGTVTFEFGIGRTVAEADSECNRKKLSAGSDSRRATDLQIRAILAQISKSALEVTAIQVTE